MKFTPKVRIMPEDVRSCMVFGDHYNPVAPFMQEAAVMMLVQQRHDESVFVLIERSRHLRNHGGEIAFAGGLRETGDQGPIETAVREVWEELSIPADMLTILGTLPDVQTVMSGFSITPVVAFLQTDFDRFRLNPGEVAGLLFVPVGLFRQKPEVLGPRYYFLQGFRYEGKVIWGATAGIIRKFLSCFFDRNPGHAGVIP
ncbi:CoA pyrophosphatase [bacterium]|nr:CoA pyrophosphatase [candidate division CSSED10-310 bacterium]